MVQFGRGSRDSLERFSGRFGAPRQVRQVAPTQTQQQVTSEQQRLQEQRQQLISTNQARLEDTQQDLAQLREEFKRFPELDKGARDRVTTSIATLNEREGALKTVLERIKRGETFSQDAINRFVNQREARKISQLQAEKSRQRKLGRKLEAIGGSRQQAIIELERAQQRLKGVLKGRPTSELTVSQAEQLTPKQRKILGIKITREEAPKTQEVQEESGFFESRVIGVDESGIQNVKVFFVSNKGERPATTQETKKFFKESKVITTAESQGVFERTKERLKSESKLLTPPIFASEFFGGKAEQARLKAEQISQKRFKKGKDLTTLESLGVVGLSALQSGSGFLAGVAELPSFAVKGVQDPVGTAKGTFQALKQEAKLAVSQAKTEPELITGRIIGDIATLKASEVALLKLEPALSRVKTRLSPKFKKVVVKGGKEVVEEIPTSFKKVDLELIQPGDLQRLSFEKQASFSGKKGLTVASAQRDLFSLFKGKRKVRKPIPGELSPLEFVDAGGKTKSLKLSPKTKELLKKFDKGVLGADDISRLESRIIKESGGSSSLLERSFFVSPPSDKGIPQLRKSRLGLQDAKPATLSDILFGDVTFRRPKSQAILFKSDVEKLPVDIKSLVRKAKAGDATARFELQRKLLPFQLEPSGKLKPFGFAGTPEGELTFAPGEILRKKKTVGKTIIQKKPVTFIEAEVIRDPKTASLLRKDPSKLTASELKQIRKATSLDISSGLEQSRFIPSSSLSAPAPLLSKKSSKDLSKDLSNVSLFEIVSPSSLVKGGSFLPRLTTRKQSNLLRPASRKFGTSPLLKPTRISRTTTRRALSTPIRGGFGRPTTPSRIIRRTETRRFLPPLRAKRLIPRADSTKRRRIPSQPSFNVFVRRQGKFRPIAQEVSLSKAIGLGKQRAEETLARTFKIVPTGSGASLKGITDVGERFRLPVARSSLRAPLTFIERSKFALSTPRELKEIGIARIKKKKKRRSRK